MSALKWYEFSQNNSGGSFEYDDKVCHRVWIQAESDGAAADKAAELGIYFEGVASGIDCECCGDRWYMPSGTEFPLVYDREKGITFDTVEKYAEMLVRDFGYMHKKHPDTRLYYADGKVAEYFK